MAVFGVLEHLKGTAETHSILNMKYLTTEFSAINSEGLSLIQSYRSPPDLLTVHMYTCKFDILYYERWSIYQNGAHAVWKFDQICYYYRSFWWTNRADLQTACRQLRGEMSITIKERGKVSSKIAKTDFYYCLCPTCCILNCQLSRCWLFSRLRYNYKLILITAHIYQEPCHLRNGTWCFSPVNLRTKYQ